MFNNNIPHKITDYFSFIDHIYKTRNKEKGNLKIEAIRTNVGKQSISYAGAILYAKKYNFPQKIQSRFKKESFRWI